MRRVFAPGRVTAVAPPMTVQRLLQRATKRTKLRRPSACLGTNSVSDRARCPFTTPPPTVTEPPVVAMPPEPGLVPPLEGGTGDDDTGTFAHRGSSSNAALCVS